MQSVNHTSHSIASARSSGCRPHDPVPPALLASSASSLSRTSHTPASLEGRLVFISPISDPTHSPTFVLVRSLVLEWAIIYKVTPVVVFLVSCENRMGVLEEQRCPPRSISLLLFLSLSLCLTLFLSLALSLLSVLDCIRVQGAQKSFFREVNYKAERAEMFKW